MGAHRNDPEAVRECPRALAAVARDFPPWQAWEGVIAGLLYARRPNCSPPMVVRSATTDGLRGEIERAEEERGLRQ